MEAKRSVVRRHVEREAEAARRRKLHGIGRIDAVRARDDRDAGLLGFAQRQLNEVGVDRNRRDHIGSRRDRIQDRGVLFVGRAAAIIDLDGPTEFLRGMLNAIGRRHAAVQHRKACHHRDLDAFWRLRGGRGPSIFRRRHGARGRQDRIVRRLRREGHSSANAQCRCESEQRRPSRSARAPQLICDTILRSTTHCSS